MKRLRVFVCCCVCWLQLNKQQGGHLEVQSLIWPGFAPICVAWSKPSLALLEIRRLLRSTQGSPSWLIQGAVLQAHAARQLQLRELREVGGVLRAQVQLRAPVAVSQGAGPLPGEVLHEACGRGQVQLRVLRRGGWGGYGKGTKARGEARKAKQAPRKPPQKPQLICPATSKRREAQRHGCIPGFAPSGPCHRAKCERPPAAAAFLPCHRN